MTYQEIISAVEEIEAGLLTAITEIIEDTITEDVVDADIFYINSELDAFYRNLKERMGVANTAKPFTLQELAAMHVKYDNALTALVESDKELIEKLGKADSKTSRVANRYKRKAVIAALDVVREMAAKAGFPGKAVLDAIDDIRAARTQEDVVEATEAPKGSVELLNLVKDALHKVDYITLEITVFSNDVDTSKYAVFASISAIEDVGYHTLSDTLIATVDSRAEAIELGESYIAYIQKYEGYMDLDVIADVNDLAEY